jgi:hypothetical protein
MGLSDKIAKAVYCDPIVEQYCGNPLIEALPPILSRKQVAQGLTGTIKFNPADIYIDGSHRAHIIAQLVDGFFQPFANHLELETKISIMLRQGYVGRNLDDGSLNIHLQNGYERVMTGELEVFRFAQAKSTAQSFSLIGCSGIGKSSTLNRILATYPQAIFHEKYNFTQIVYLKIDCPHDGSLKQLCNHFFEAVDEVLHTDYKTKYALKRHTVETLMALMSQIANVHALGLLVIDEIQHLSASKSGGIEKMLNFFVTLVNVIGLPVIMVGTPKAKSILEIDLRSARRSTGFGALLWGSLQAPSHKTEPDQIKLTEWGAFTNKLWQYQWLQKRDEMLTEEMRSCWYDLSQGVLDIVVKLFVLSQLRAIITGIERVTPELMRKVYEDEFKPVHPMLAALRSGDPEQIIKYSDLTIDDFDKKLLALNVKISALKSESHIPRYGGNEQALRLHNLLAGMECQSELIEPLIEKAFKEYPYLTIRELMPIILEWYGSEKPESKKQKNKPIILKPSAWHTLDSDDLRFKFSQCEQEQYVYEKFKKSGLVFDTDSWLKNLS